ncbi:putative NTPase (NACHT family) [Fuerstiella marisgermanici]|uniref:Putative NTPase (NACHT family) n=2 Tax=Fuerstiella marisgermanici TaxID=1891926 RepID=A0A1P8WBV9_9PLAN|nr:putative NTPase (NACHT family) [Fuerstiella marisgermanici]
MTRHASQDSLVEARSLIIESGESQTRLAEMSGVSRVQISRIANGRVSSVSEKTLRLLRQAVGAERKRRHENGGSKESGSTDRYRDLIEQKLSRKSFAGLGFPELAPQPLEDIFVMPEAIRQIHDEPADADCDDEVAMAARVARDLYADSPRENERLSAEEAIHAFPRLIILGCPGSGKTTFMQYATVMTSRGDFFQSDCLPVFIRLPEFAAAMVVDPKVDFFGWIKARVESLGASEFGKTLQVWLEDQSKRLLFLLDGLDEVPDDTSRIRLVETTRNFIAKFAANRFCLTSRPIGFDPEPWRALGFEVVRLLEYGDSQIRKTISKWSPLIQTGDDFQVAQNLEKAIWENSRVRQIASNPLILTILIFLCRSRNYVLPRRRVDLYEKVAEVFLETWEASKRPSGEFSETLGIDLDARDLEWLVADLALQMQRNGVVTAKRWWIEQCWHEALSTNLGFDDQIAKDATARLLRFVSGRTGIFEERSLDLYAFSHRTLQEFFAAVGLMNEADNETHTDLETLVRPYLFHPEWDETIRLVTARITPPRAERLVRLMLDDLDPSGRFLYRGPLLAMRCLLDGSTIANRQVVDQLFHSMDRLGASPWLGITMRCLDRLRQFEGSRYALHASQAIGRIVDLAKQELEPDDVEELESAGFDFPEIDVEKLSAEFNKPAAVVKAPLADGSAEPVYIPNFKLMKDDFPVWQKDATRRLRDANTPNEVKHCLIVRMAMQSNVHANCFPVLARVVQDEPDEELKALTISVIGRFANADEGAVALLKGLLSESQSDTIRAEAAWALGSVADSDAKIYKMLRDLLLDANESSEVRRNAAHALTEAVVNDAELVDMILVLAYQDSQKGVRMALLHALRKCVQRYRHVREAFMDWAAGEGTEARVTCQILARLLAEGEIEWDQSLSLRIEEVLRRIGIEDGLGKPCPHVLSALIALVETRESRGGVTLQEALADAFESIKDRLEHCFVFGSTARNQQSADSDIDVMMIGDVTMDVVAPLLKKAERILGRQINPAIYSLARFRKRLQDGNHFIATVMQEPKLPVRWAGNSMTEKELDDELRAMASERLVG